MAMTREQFLDLIDPAMAEIYSEKYQMYQKVYAQIYNMMSMTGAYEKLSQVTGLGYLQQKNELEDGTFEDRVQMYNKTLTALTYVLIAEVAQELIEDERKDIIAQTPKVLASSTVATENMLAAQPFNRAFDTNYLGADGVVLCSTAHPNHPQSAGTWANNATAATMTQTAIMAARLRMRKLTNPKGLPVIVEPKILLTGPDLNDSARTILGTERELGSQNWDINILNSAGITPIQWRDITSTTAWFMLAGKDQHDLRWYDRIQAEFSRDTSFIRDSALYKARRRCVCGYLDPRGVDGNEGA